MPLTSNDLLGKVLDKPCPDCGRRLILMLDHRGEGRYHCEDFPDCRGNVGCFANGEPVGTPINGQGRRMRMDLHEYVDSFWKCEGMRWDQLQDRRTMVYQYMQLVVPVPIVFHIGSLDIPELEICMKVAQENLPRFAALSGLKTVKGDESAWLVNKPQLIKDL